MTTLIHYAPASGIRASCRKHRNPGFFGHNDDAIRRLMEAPMAGFATSYNSIFNDLDRMLLGHRDGFAGSLHLPAVGGRSSSNPRIETHEDDTQWTIDIELPGVASDDIKVTLEQNVLEISGKTRKRHTGTKPKAGSDSDHTRAEELRQFQYSYTLPPQGTDTDNIGASLVNGVLHVSVPKTNAPRRSILITSDGTGTVGAVDTESPSSNVPVVSQEATTDVVA